MSFFKKYERMFEYIGIAAIALLLFGLLGWYFFLRGQSAEIEGTAEARGFNIGVPSFFGERGSTAANIETVPVTSTDAATSSEQVAPRFWKAGTSPVAGFAFVKEGSSDVLRFVERSTGYVVDVNPTTGAIARRTNTLTPKMYRASVGRGGTIVKQSLDGYSLLTISGDMGSTTDANGYVELFGETLGGSIRDVTAAPFSSDIVFLAEDSGTTRLVRATSEGNAPKQLLLLGIGDFKIIWTESRILLVERTASGVGGSAYDAGVALTPILRNVPGLLVAPQATSSGYLYSSDDGQTLHLYLRSSKDTSVVSLPLTTIADKCVWGPGGNAAYCAVPRAVPTENFLDNWYRGTVHTVDTWYRIDISGSVSELFAPDESLGIDVEHPRVDASGEYIAFTNARDKSLWILRVSEKYEQ